MSKSHALLRFLRQLHLYIGVFIAPAVLFFAFTGALQLFSLHETTPGSSYQPPKWAMVLAQIHKKQTPVLNPKKQPAPSAHPAAQHSGRPHAGDAGAPDHAASEPATTAPQPPPGKHHPLPLKIFFLLVALGLFTSTLTGLYMTWKFAHRRHGLLSALFLAGILIPAALLCV